MTDSTPDITPGIAATFQPRRILVCQQRQLGDVLLTTPALELLRGRFPRAVIHVLTERKCLPMLERNPHVDHVWALDKAAMPTLWHEVQWYWRVARTGYDLVINFQPTLPRLRWVVGFSGAKVRLTTTPPWYLRPLYTHVTPPSTSYAAAAKAALLAPLGITWQGERPRLYLADAEREQARALLRGLGMTEGQTLITLDPTHRQPTRRWPVAEYARLIALLIQAGEGADERAKAEERAGVGGIRFLPLWGPGEEDDIRELTALVSDQGFGDRLLLPDRMLTLRETAACMEAAALHIGNCSAPRHMAVAVGTPTCIARGSTGSEWTCPPVAGAEADHVSVAAGLDCQPCESNHCRLAPASEAAPCMVALTTEHMADAALGLLRTRRTHVF